MSNELLEENISAGPHSEQETLASNSYARKVKADKGGQ